MRRIDGGKDSVLTWGDLYGTRSNLRKSACESRAERTEVSRSHITHGVATPAEGLNMK
jgi:hypothetical protein